VTDSASTGFRRRTFVLEFEDPSFNGLIVRARSASLGDFTRMQELMLMNLGTDEHLDERHELFDRLAGTDEYPGLIKSWNVLDDNDQPVPIDPESLAKEEWPLIRNICRAWRAALIEVPRPLSQPSSDGDRLAGLSIPMQTLPASTTTSPNLLSSSTPSESSDSALDSDAFPNPEDS
jgi:hypothetical protein